MHTHPRRSDSSWLEIDLSRVRANVRALRAVLQPSDVRRTVPRLCAVVKADAYGLGVEAVAQCLASADGDETASVDMFAVDSPAEAQTLVEIGIEQPILLLMPLRDLDSADPLVPTVAAGRLHLTIHDPTQLEQADGIGRALGCRVPVHVYLDTGMSRSGMDEHDAGEQITCVAGMKGVRLAGVMSHLATADEDAAFANEQSARLNDFLEKHRDGIAPDVTVHLANTFGTLRGAALHYGMVRVGLGLLGYGPGLIVDDPKNAAAPGLLPVVRWLSRVNHVGRFARGAAVGYGCSHQLVRDSVLGVVPVGYADGYPLALSNRSSVGVLDAQGEVCGVAPVLGRVSMNQIVIDLTDCAGGGERTGGVDTEVELISHSPQSACSLPRLAELAQTNCYELLCRLSARLVRRYIAADAIGGDRQESSALRSDRRPTVSDIS